MTLALLILVLAALAALAERRVRMALVILAATVAGCEYLPPIVLPTPPPVTQPPAPSPTPQPSPSPSPSGEPAPPPTPEPAPSPSPTPKPTPTPEPCPRTVDGPPGCTSCADQLAYLEQQGYFRPIGGIWYESDNCGAAMASSKCEYLNARPHLGFPACSVWRRTLDAAPKRAPEGNTCVPRVIECPPPSPGPGPSPSGGSCTANGLGIVKVGIGSLGCNDGLKCHWHATVRFGTAAGQNGKPCDGAHPPCGQEPPGSQCEPCGGAICDPTVGAVWTASGGLQVFGTEENDYKVTTKGRGKLTACPAPNPVTASGVLLRVHGSACTTVNVP